LEADRCTDNPESGAGAHRAGNSFRGHSSAVRDERQDVADMQDYAQGNDAWRYSFANYSQRSKFDYKN